MKFQDNLDYYQNRRAWENHYETAPRTTYATLTLEEKTWLCALNEQLSNTEKKYSEIMSQKHAELQSKVNDANDWLMEFNLDYRITFYLREDDPEFEENNDNILIEIENSFLSEEVKNRHWGLGATHVNHAESEEMFEGELHGYLYHQLYDHCGLDWRDLLRIGSLYFEIKIDEQSGSLPVRGLR